MNDMSPADEALRTDEALPTDAEGFAALGLHESLLTALAALGYEEPTPIQREAIPPIIEGRDLLGQAATGTGKTAAFALPILERLHRGTRQNEPLALVLVPTRELAMQVSEAIHKYGRAFDARVVPIYGGQPIVRQLQALKRGVDIVVATPGRAIDHIKRGTLPLDLIPAPAAMNGALDWTTPSEPCWPRSPSAACAAVCVRSRSGACSASKN